EILLSDRIAIFDGGDGGHPGLSVLKEGGEVHDAEEIDAGCKEIRIFSEAGHGHVPAIRATRDADAFGVGNLIVHEIVDARLDVLHAVETQFAVIEVDELLSESRRTAHVGREYADASRK